MIPLSINSPFQQFILKNQFKNTVFVLPTNRNTVFIYQNIRAFDAFYSCQSDDKRLLNF